MRRAAHDRSRCTRAVPYMQRGMTLVEVLVTLIIMSVGLLGVAALQLTSLRNNYDAYTRSQAAVLAADILDRMRANRSAAISGTGYTVALGTYNSNTTQAERDISAWKATLAQQLPVGDGDIARDPATGIVTIRIQWSERDDAAGQTLTFQTMSVI